MIYNAESAETDEEKATLLNNYFALQSTVNDNNKEVPLYRNRHMQGYNHLHLHTKMSMMYSTSSPKGNDRSPEFHVQRSNVVFSAIKANHSKVNSPETLFSPL